ncbi:MAG: RnfH family protein [Burkholderiaceae bacterium]
MLTAAAVNRIRLYISAMSSTLTVTVAYCAPGIEDVSEVQLPPGACVQDAIEAAKLLARRQELSNQLDVGIWGRRCSLNQRVADGDRVEVYRPLTIDPKEARRLRAALRRKTTSCRRSE